MQWTGGGRDGVEKEGRRGPLRLCKYDVGHNLHIGITGSPVMSAKRSPEKIVSLGRNAFRGCFSVAFSQFQVRGFFGGSGSLHVSPRLSGALPTLWFGWQRKNQRARASGGAPALSSGNVAREGGGALSLR